MFKSLALVLMLSAAPVMLGVAAAHAKPHAVAARSPQAALDGIVKAYDAWVLSEDPFSAEGEGDRSARSKMPDVTLAADHRREARLKVFKTELTRIDPKALTAEGRLNRSFLLRVLDVDLQSYAFDEGRMPFNSDGGFNATMGYVASGTQIDTKADGEAWITRLQAIPKYYADNIDNARRGITTGFTQPKITVEQVIAQARRQADAPLESDVLMGPFASMPATISAADQVALKARALEVIRAKVRPAQRGFVTFLETEYLPKARPQLGASTLPNGRAYYSWLVRRYTTTDITPDEVHALGLKEVARIRAEMDATIAETGFKGTFPEFLAYLRTDPKFYAKSRQELLEKASEIAKRIDDKLPHYFATLPRLTYGVRPVPADIEDGYTTGRYFGGSPALGIAGGYMVNTSHLDQRALYELPSLTLHEAVPGHHLQIALGQELVGVPAFRRNANMTAFTEGWGLYSEKLGVEMGIYRDPYERFGRLSYEMWRACRLVADTGIHWLGWSLEEARACFTDNTALSPKNIEVELARYISWPGQADAYKIGEIKLWSLRHKAEAALGPKFDIRRFHDAVLLAGPLPLDLLEERIDAWIATEKARK
ncbi:MAG: hypothetical protein JWP35_3033 [Caulobacter sp.]|nr:hypothetical protein [Caulobacter sp.]